MRRALRLPVIEAGTVTVTVAPRRAPARRPRSRKAKAPVSRFQVGPYVVTVTQCHQLPELEPRQAAMAKAVKSRFTFSSQKYSPWMQGPRADERFFCLIWVVPLRRVQWSSSGGAQSGGGAQSESESPASGRVAGKVCCLSLVRADYIGRAPGPRSKLLRQPAKLQGEPQAGPIFMIMMDSGGDRVARPDRRMILNLQEEVDETRGPAVLPWAIHPSHRRVPCRPTNKTLATKINLLLMNGKTKNR